MRSFSLIVLLWMAWAAWAAPAVTSSFTVVASFYPVYIATLNVARDVPGVTVLSLAPPSAGCLHDYQLTPADVLTLDRADALVINGAGMEAAFEPLLKRRPRLPVVDASDGVALIVSSPHHGCAHHAHTQACAPAPNPHVWLSVTRHIRQVDNIAHGLAAMDPARAALYLTNAAWYTAALRQLRCEMRRTLADLSARTIVTMHDALPYFAQEFDLTIAGVVQREPGHAPGARHLAQLATRIKEARIPAIFTEPQYADAAAQTLARETGAALVPLDTIVSGPAELDAYCAAMRRNARALAEALAPPAHE